MPRSNSAGAAKNGASRCRDEYSSNACVKIILPPFENFAAQLWNDINSSRPARNWPKPCANFGSDLKVEQTLERWTLDEEQSANRQSQSAIHSTVWEQMNAWLDNVALAFPREALPLRDWLPILEAGLAEPDRRRDSAGAGRGACRRD